MMTFDQALALVLECATNTLRTKEAHHAYDQAETLRDAIDTVRTMAVNRNVRESQP